MNFYTSVVMNSKVGAGTTPSHAIEAKCLRKEGVGLSLPSLFAQRFAPECR